MKKVTLLVLLCLTSFSFYSQIKKETNSTNFKTITGLVFNSSNIIKGVNIKVLGSTRGTTTDAKGNFTLKVKNNEILQFSHIGHKPLKILIEKTTKLLKIELRELTNILEEVTIKTKVHKIKPKVFIRMGNGFVNTRKFTYLESKDLNQSALSIASAIRGRISGIKVRRNRFGEEVVFLRGRKPVLWLIDGLKTSETPLIDVSQIKRVAVLKSLAELVLYGSEGAGGVIIVETFSNTALDPNENVNAKDNPHTNKNYYEKDAVSYKEIEKSNPQYLNFLETTESSLEAFNFYKKTVSKNQSKQNFHMDVAKYIYQKYKNKQYTSLILKDLEKVGKGNSEILKSIAYKYQEMNLHQEALRVYKNLMQLNPNHAQSFRDLANTYTHLKQYKNAWKIYKYYFSKGFILDKNAIGEMIAFEMEALSQRTKEETKIADKLNFKDLGIDKDNDVRIVFEWNTTDAEFSLEFVNQNEQSYVIDHTLYESNDLIIDEKLKGYNSKQYIINPLSQGNWMVNVNYFGNKTRKPTFLKVTTYYNWGRKNQTEKIDLFELSVKYTKAQLLTINSKIVHNKSQIALN